MKAAAPAVPWDDYAGAYDLMAELNPAYQDLLLRFGTAADKWPLEPGAMVLDTGAGTGNFTLRAAAMHLQAIFLHTEPEPAMQRRAQEKTVAAGCTNVRFLPHSAESLHFAQRSLSGAILAHVLYALPDPHVYLQRLHGWLRPGAPVWACDLGRILDVGAWRRYLVREVVRSRGLSAAVRALWRGRAVTRANHRIAAAQRTGQFWLHDGAEFATFFRNAGFHVENVESAYRGDSDLLLATA